MNILLLMGQLTIARVAVPAFARLGAILVVLDVFPLVLVLARLTVPGLVVITVLVDALVLVQHLAQMTVLEGVL